MESVIKWQVGIPKEDGSYLVTYYNSEQALNVCTCLFRLGYVWVNGDYKEIDMCKIIAWCKLTDIEPYKEERKMNEEDKELLLKDLCARLPYGVKNQMIDSDGIARIE